MFQLSAGEKDMLLLGVYNTITDNHAVHLEEGSKGEGGEAAPAQSLHGGQQNRVQGHLQIRLQVSTLA